MSVGQALITAEEFKEIAVDYDGLVELVRGEVVEMTRPGGKHGGVCLNVGRIVGNWAEDGRHGRIACNDSGVVTERDPDSVRGPELYYVRMERLPGGVLPEGWLEIPPDLCMEVLSPHDRWGDVLGKIDEYFALGVPEVWVLDPKKREVQIHRFDAEALSICRAGETWTSDQLPGFECAVSELFEGC